MQLTVGCDPEFFLFDNKDKMYKSAHGLVPGNKKNPHKLKDGAVQLDGTAVEFNINPASTKEEFAFNIRSVLQEIRQMIPERYEFRFEPAIDYDPEYYEKHVPEDCKELGCDPDYDSLREGEINNPPQARGTMRTGAGHLHFGWTKDKDPHDYSHFTDCVALNNKAYHYFKAFSPMWDKDNRRASMYGGNGAFRPKHYGFEHRVLSNAWVKHPELWDWVYDSAQKIFSSCVENKFEYGYHGFGYALTPIDKCLHYTGIKPVAFPQQLKVFEV